MIYAALMILTVLDLVYVQPNCIISNDLLLIFFFTDREISKLGDLLSMDVCMEILDILYETEDTSWLFNFACPLAASTLVCSLNAAFPLTSKIYCIEL
jgi:hypothetical protein